MNINLEIEKSEKQVKEIQSEIKKETARLQSFGSRENYFSMLTKAKESENQLAILKSKRRTEIMEKIAKEEILPRVEALRNTPMNEEKRIHVMMELALYSAAIQKLKTNFVIFQRVGEVLFQVDDPEMKLLYGEKREEIATYLKRIPQQQDVAEIRDEKWVLKDPPNPVVVALPYGKAVSLERENRGKIVSSDEPVFQEVIREDREPEIMPLVRRMSLGNPIPGIDGKLSPQAETLQKRCLSGKLEISPMGFAPFVMEHEIKRVLKKFGIE